MLSYYLFDLQLRVLMTIAIELAVAFATFFVEDKDFIALYQIFHYLANHLCAIHGRSADGHCAVIIDKQHFLKFNSLTIFCFWQMVHEETLACFGSELLTVNLYDCVHF